jgi:hypothetical protein
MELVKGEFFEVSGINCSIENPSFVTAVISAAQFRFSRPWATKRLSPSIILVMVQNQSLLDEFTFPLIFFIIANFHNKLKRQEYFRYFIFNRF